MRYFEIVKPPARYISANAEQRDAAGEPCSGRLRDQWRSGYVDSWNPWDRHCNFARPQYPFNRQSRRRHLSPRRLR